MAEPEASQKFQKELNAGLSSLAVLALVVKANRPMYGYEVATELAGIAPERLPMNQGALYPVLRSLERSGLLISHMERSDAGPPRRYYTVTGKGRHALGEWTEAWRRTRAFIELVLEDEHASRRKSSSRRPAVS